MASSDIQAKRVAGAGSLAVGPARVRQVQVLTGAGAGRLTARADSVADRPVMPAGQPG